MPRPPPQREHRVPRHFFCPISGTFMKEPVIVPSTQETCDLEAFRTRRMNTNPFPVEDQEELFMPDYSLRSQMFEWLQKYERRPTFAYVSTPQDLDSAVTSLLTQYPNDILEDSDLLDNLRQLKSAIRDKMQLRNSEQVSLLLIRLVEGCPVSPDNAAEWVKLSVVILDNGRCIQENPSLFENHQRPLLEVIDRVCADIEDSDFERALVNLVHYLLFYVVKDIHIITSHGGVIEVLSSHILKPANFYGHFVESDFNFDNLFYVINRLYSGQEGWKQPKLLQTVASLVWPIHRQLSRKRYHGLLEDISYFVRYHNVREDSLEVMTRAGVVSRVFQLLEYATLDEDRRGAYPMGWDARDRAVDEEEEEDMIMRCFEILCFLSSVTIGRLEIVRVIKRSGFKVFDAFCTAIQRYLHHETLESHVIPAFSVLCNLLENTRYVEMENTDDRGLGEGDFESLRQMDFGRFDHEGLTTIATRLFGAVDRVETEEAVSEDDTY